MSIINGDRSTLDQYIGRAIIGTPSGFQFTSKGWIEDQNIDLRQFAYLDPVDFELTAKSKDPVFFIYRDKLKDGTPVIYYVVYFYARERKLSTNRKGFIGVLLGFKKIQPHPLTVWDVLKGYADAIFGILDENSRFRAELTGQAFDDLPILDSLVEGLNQGNKLSTNLEKRKRDTLIRFDPIISDPDSFFMRSLKSPYLSRQHKLYGTRNPDVINKIEKSSISGIELISGGRLAAIDRDLKIEALERENVDLKKRLSIFHHEKEQEIAKKDKEILRLKRDAEDRKERYDRLEEGNKKEEKGDSSHSERSSRNNAHHDAQDSYSRSQSKRPAPRRETLPDSTQRKPQPQDLPPNPTEEIVFKEKQPSGWMGWIKKVKIRLKALKIGFIPVAFIFLIIIVLIIFIPVSLDSFQGNSSHSSRNVSESPSPSRAATPSKPDEPGAQNITGQFVEVTPGSGRSSEADKFGNLSSTDPVEDNFDYLSLRGEDAFDYFYGTPRKDLIVKKDGKAEKGELLRDIVDRIFQEYPQGTLGFDHENFQKAILYFNKNDIDRDRMIARKNSSSILFYIKKSHQ